MRADLYLTENGYLSGRQRAKAMIEEGRVRIDGQLIKKPSQEILPGEHEVLLADLLPYVGRGGLKLAAALDAFSVSVTGLCALDIGASTGGFTDCLLQRGAAKVYAVDAGIDQLAPSLRADPRVIVREHLNARTLSKEDIEGALVDMIVMDVSFISATYILPRFPLVLKDGGIAVCLIKPQFEVGKAMLGKGGIVKTASARLFAVQRVCECAAQLGLVPTELIPSPIEGGDGNREFLVLLRWRDPQAKAIDAETMKRTVLLS